MEIRLIIDEHSGAEYVNTRDDSRYTNINLNPLIGISINKPGEIDDDGNRIKAPWNPNDHLAMTKYNLPILYEELHGIQQDMKTAELYTYHGKRLELNESIAESIRRVFMIGNTTIELSAVVITTSDENRVEGIKMKFNNEQSSVLLTLNELNSLIFNIDHIDIDSITILMYKNFINRPSGSNSGTVFNTDFPLPSTNVDILPKE